MDITYYCDTEFEPKRYPDFKNATSKGKYIELNISPSDVIGSY